MNLLQMRSLNKNIRLVINMKGVQFGNGNKPALAVST